MITRVVFHIAIVIWIAVSLDERFLTIWYAWKQRLRTPSIPIDRYGTVVWEQPISSPFSRRSVFNPSILFDNSRWIVISRFTRGRRALQCFFQYALEDDEIKIDGVRYRATMLATIFNKDFGSKIEEFPIYTRTYGGVRDPLFWQGEDPRIFVRGKRVFVQSTLHRPDGRRCLAHGTLENIGPKVVYVPRSVIQSPVDEKNWSSIPGFENIFLTHVHPRWKVARLSEDGTPSFFVDEISPENLKGLRCTSGCRPFGKNLLTCLHSVHPYRTYLCEISPQTFLPLRMSPVLEFSAGENYIEFPSGLETIGMGEFVYFGVGLNDSGFKIYRMRGELVDSILSINLIND